MRGRRKKSIIIGTFILLCLYLSFLIFHNALEANQVEERLVLSQPAVNDGQTKSTLALEKGAKPKRALPSNSTKNNFTIVIDPGHQHPCQ